MLLVFIKFFTFVVLLVFLNYNCSKFKFLLSDTPEVKVVQGDDQEHDTQSTTDMFKDMLTQKKNLLLSKLTSLDSDVSTSTILTFCACFASYALKMTSTRGEYAKRVKLDRRVFERGQSVFMSSTEFVLYVLVMTNV